MMLAISLAGEAGFMGRFLGCESGAPVAAEDSVLPQG